MGHKIHCNPPYLLRPAGMIEKAGADLGCRRYGAWSLMSMRREMGGGVWTREFRPDFDAVESGMDTFVNWKKGFFGKAATKAARAARPKQKLVTMTINVDGIDASNDEAILKDGEAVGYASSGGYRRRAGQSMTRGSVGIDKAGPDTEVEVEIPGGICKAKVPGAPLFGANGANMRALGLATGHMDSLAGTADEAPVRCLFLLLNSFSPIDSACVTALLNAANGHSERTLFEWVLSREDGRQITVPNRLKIGADTGLADASLRDVVFVFGGDGCEHDATDKITTWLRNTRRTGARVVSMGGATGPLAGARMRDALTASVHWLLRAAIEDAFHQINVVLTIFTMEIT